MVSVRDELLRQEPETVCVAGRYQPSIVPGSDVNRNCPLFSACKFFQGSLTL